MTLHKKPLPFICWVLASVLFFTGCQYNPHAHLLTTTEPSPEDIVGTYVLDRYDLPENIVKEKIYIKVELRPDGTFTATNIPPGELDEPDGTFFSKLQSGQGEWEKDVIGTLDLGSKRIWGVRLLTSDDRFGYAHFTGEKPPYGLIFTLGDPDSGNAILLKKE